MYKRIDYEDRKTIERMLKSKAPVAEIAKEIGKSRKSVYYEIRKGLCKIYGKNLEEITVYSAKVAQDRTDINYTSHGPGLKIGNNHKAAQDISDYIRRGFSPYAASVRLRRDGVISLSRNTIYSYIYQGFIPGVTSKNLLIGRRRKRSYSPVVRKHKHLYGASIDQRPAHVLGRLDFGHWEMDTVVSKAGKSACLLVLTERKARCELIAKLPNKEAVEVAKYIKRLRQVYGQNFCRIFKTITCDNGSEFAQVNLVKAYGTDVYFAHPYSAFERGSNENANRFIRRFYPKGTDFADVSDDDIARLRDWMNSYPREILGGYSAAEVRDACEAS